jgi:hypothetical protein
VAQYLDQFTQLAWYANDEYMTEGKNMEKYLGGLVPSLKCHLVVHTFPDFKTLVDKAIILENEHRNMNKFRKHRMNQTASSHNNRPWKEFQRPMTPRLAAPLPRPTVIAPRPQQSHSAFNNRAKDTTFHPGVTCCAYGEEGHYYRQCPK